MKRTLPTWCKEVKKSMIDDDLNVTELAERVGLSRNYVSGVVNGRVYAPEIAKISVYMQLLQKKLHWQNWTALTKNGAGNTLRLQSHGKITGQIFQRILSIRKLSDV